MIVCGRKFVVTLSLLLAFSATGEAAVSYFLRSSPTQSLGATLPSATIVAQGIQAAWGRPVSVVSSLTSADTTYPPITADSAATPSYTYGPAANGIIQNFSLNSVVIAGVVSGQLLDVGTEVDSCGFIAPRFILRAFTSTQSYDVLVREIDCNGNSSSGGSVNLSFYQVSGPKAVVGSLYNISARAYVKVGNNTLIGGFTISGGGSRQILVRGLGPSLANFGLSNVLSNPVLDLYDSSGSLIYHNKNWKDAQRDAIIATGLQPSDDKEAAILLTLNPGSYTAILSGNNSGKGLGLLEVYSLDGTAQVTNLSARANIGTQSNVLIAGLIVQSTPQVIFRGLGPTLADFGLMNSLRDPALQLFDANGNLIAANDNWQDSQGTAIQNSGYAPPHHREAAILATLLPGNYTAVESGVGGTTGLGLLDIYQLN